MGGHRKLQQETLSQGQRLTGGYWGVSGQADFPRRGSVGRLRKRCFSRSLCDGRNGVERAFCRSRPADASLRALTAPPPSCSAASTLPPASRDILEYQPRHEAAGIWAAEMRLRTKVGRAATKSEGLRPKGAANVLLRFG